MLGLGLRGLARGARNPDARNHWTYTRGGLCTLLNCAQTQKTGFVHTNPVFNTCAHNRAHNRSQILLCTIFLCTKPTICAQTLNSQFVHHLFHKTLPVFPTTARNLCTNCAQPRMCAHSICAHFPLPQTPQKTPKFLLISKGIKKII